MGGLREEARMEVFRRTLESCELVDISYSGPWFTWERGQLLENNVRERIDRGVVNDACSSSYLNRILSLAKGLRQWAARITVKKGYKVKKLTRKFAVMNDTERTDDLLAELLNVKLYLNMEMDKEEWYWEQHAKANWLQWVIRILISFTNLLLREDE
ncbi:hypothetical protein PVK06_044111 [Gossypium arboreum]|uniref:Reverse transcriptase n=1 Tax=Gossypium arboreum TaxID=29729 RepID=A0ABR0MQQ4_GOSAR|nr:hypothetical protein PVK06_044111 [Gossypium arboreum]